MCVERLIAFIAQYDDTLRSRQILMLLVTLRESEKSYMPRIASFESCFPSYEINDLNNIFYIFQLRSPPISATFLCDNNS
jgi:hypothetical protein